MRPRPPSARSGTASTASRGTRPRCPAAGALVAAADLLHRADHRSEGIHRMSVGRPGTSYGRVGAGGYGGAGGPRPGAFRTRPRSLLTRATSRDSFLRHVDWALIAAVLALCVLGVLLVWSATEPTLAQRGASTRTYLDKQAIYVVLGLVLMGRGQPHRLPPAPGLRARSSTARPCSACWRSSPRSARPSTAPPAGSICPAASRSSRPSTPRSRSS